MSIRRSTSAETAARFAAMRKQDPYRRQPNKSARPATRRPPTPIDRITINFGRATLEEILSALCDRIADGLDTHITRIAEDMVRSALEHKP